MKTILFGLVLAGSLAARAQDIPDHPDKLKFPPLTFTVPDPAAMRSALSNGAVVYALEDHALPLVEIRVMVRAGSFWQPKGKEGLASLCGALMRTAGTATRNPNELDEQIDALAAEVGVSLGETTGAANLSILSKDLDDGIAILFDVLRNPAFQQDRIDLLKAQVMRQLQSRNDATAGIEGREASLLFYGADFPVNAHPTKGSVESITREDLLAFHKESFYPSNFVIAAAGDFKKEELLAKLTKACEGWKSVEGKARQIPKVTNDPKPGVYCFHKEGKNINQGRVTIGHLGIDIQNPDVHGLRIMAYILGAGGFSSRLTDRVRTKEGLAYDVNASFPPGVAYTGLFRMQFQSKSESCLFAAKLCMEELERIRKDPVEKKELDSAISFYVDGFPAFFFSTKFQSTTTFANAEINGYPKDYFQTYREKIKAVTADEVKRVAEKYCRPDKLVVVVVGNTSVIKQGDGKHDIKLEEFGTVVDVPLPDPMTLERPKQ